LPYGSKMTSLLWRNCKRSIYMAYSVIPAHRKQEKYGWHWQWNLIFHLIRYAQTTEKKHQFFFQSNTVMQMYLWWWQSLFDSIFVSYTILMATILLSKIGTGQFGASQRVWLWLHAPQLPTRISYFRQMGQLECGIVKVANMLHKRSAKAKKQCRNDSIKQFCTQSQVEETTVIENGRVMHSYNSH